MLREKVKDIEVTAEQIKDSNINSDVKSTRNGSRKLI